MILDVNNSHPEASLTKSLRFGAELEIPICDDERYHMMARGRPVPAESAKPDIHGTEITHEWISASPSTHGWEARTHSTMHAAMLSEWYDKLYQTIEQEHNRIEPVGFHGRGTAGLHVHLSELSERDANLIREVSREPWMKALACTSIAAYDSDGTLLPKYPVVRGNDTDVKNPCKDQDPCGFGRDKLVAERRERGHYEWRLPEPMLPESFHILLSVLTRTLRDGKAAGQIRAMNILETRPEDVTAIQRARAIQEKHGDLPAAKAERNETMDLILEYM